MSEKIINEKKEAAFSAIIDSLLSIETEESTDVEETGYMLDVIEQVHARVIASCCMSKKEITEMCKQSFDNVEQLAEEFMLEEENHSHD